MTTGQQVKNRCLAAIGVPNECDQRRGVNEMNGGRLQSVLRDNFNQLRLSPSQGKGGNTNPYHHGVTPKEGFAEHLDTLSRYESDFFKLASNRQSVRQGVHADHARWLFSA